MNNNGELTAKQKRFCEEYMVDLNATQAIIRAKYTKKSASSMGYENLKKGEIRRYIRELMKARSLRTQLTADMVLLELAKIGFAKEGVKIKDKLKALDMLAKYLSSSDNQNIRPIFERIGWFEEFVMDMDEEDKKLYFKNVTKCAIEEANKTPKEEREEFEKECREEWGTMSIEEREEYEKIFGVWRNEEREATRTGAKTGGNGEDQ